MNHPRDLELDSFLKRTASVRELVEMGTHLAECAECRARLEAGMSAIDAGSSARDGIAGLHRELAHARWEEHLSEEDVQVLAQGGRVPGAESHVERCSNCRAEVEDLRQFIQSRKRPFRASYWLAAAAIIVAGISIFLWRSAHQAQALPSEYAALVEKARTSQRLEVSPVIAVLHRGPEQLLGDRPTVASFALLSPLGEASISNPPTFSWEAFVGAGYRVEVYDEDFRKVALSPEISATSWTPDQPLDSAHIYSWTVTARIALTEIRSPVPPAPEAKFTIVAPDQAAQLGAAIRKYPNDHLLLAALYAKAGAINEARREVTLMGDSSLARHLADSIALP